MLTDIEIAAAREQKAQPLGAFAGVEEQAADFGRSFQIGREGEHFGAECAAQFPAVLGQGAEAVGIERVLLPDFAEELAGAAYLARLAVFQHEDDHLIGHAVVGAGERLCRPLQLGREGFAIGRQIGETAAG